MTSSDPFGRASAALLVERLTKVYADGMQALQELELRRNGQPFFVGAFTIEAARSSPSTSSPTPNGSTNST